ncbi:MAG: hypothetical protein V3U65_06530 [Granulosicoccaceae bacterium]
MNFKFVPIGLITILLAACSSSGSDDNDNDSVIVPDPIQGMNNQNADPTVLSLDAIGSISLPSSMAEGIPGSELIGQLEIENNGSENGVEVSITGYGFTAMGSPRITLRLDNAGKRPIFEASCNLAVYLNTEKVGEGIALPANFSVIDIGESAVYPARIVNQDAGFDSFNRLEINCQWKEGDNNRIDLSIDPVKFEFLGYNLSQLGRPEVRLLLTNTSGDSISGASCFVEAKQGNVIVDVAKVIFLSSDGIQAGAAIEDSGIFFFFDSLAGFGANQFSAANMNCTYRENL